MKRSSWIMQVGSKPICFKDTWGRFDRQKRRWYIAKTEITVTWSEAKESREFQQPYGDRRGRKHSPQEPPERGGRGRGLGPANTLISDFWPLELQENQFQGSPLLSQTSSFVVIWYNSPRKLIGWWASPERWEEAGRTQKYQFGESGPSLPDCCLLPPRIPLLLFHTTQALVLLRGSERGLARSVHAE